MRENKNLLIGVFLLGVLLFAALVGEYLPFVDTSFDEGRMRFEEGTGNITRAPFPPSSEDWFGTDRDGRDLFSLIILGTRDTLLFMVVVTCLKYLLAVPLGLLARKGSGFLYFLLSTWSSVLSGLPLLIMGIILFQSNLFTHTENRFFLIAGTIALLEIGRVGLLFQQLANKVSTEAYIEAAVTIGSTPRQLLQNHYLVALAPEILINFILDLGRTALLIGQLGVFQIYLNFQVVPMGDVPIVNNSYNWGSLLGEAKNEIIRAPWIAFTPALAITFAIYTFNTLGSGLRKAMYRE